MPPICALRRWRPYDLRGRGAVDEGARRRAAGVLPRVLSCARGDGSMLNEVLSGELPEFDLPPLADDLADDLTDKPAPQHADPLERARLAEVLAEYRVAAGSARTLSVAAGQYVQVIDVRSEEHTSEL